MLSGLRMIGTRFALASRASSALPVMSTVRAPGASVPIRSNVASPSSPGMAKSLRM